MSDWWQRRTLRFRLAVWYAAGGTFLLVAFSSTIYLYVARAIARPLDYQLRRDLATIRSHLSGSRPDQLQWDGVRLTADRPWDAQNPWFELWDEQGRLIHRAWPQDLPAARYPDSPPVPGRESVAIRRFNPALRMRVLTLPYEVPGQSQPWMIRVFHLHTPVGDTLNALFGIIAFSLPVVIAALVLGGYALTRRWLTPLDSMASEASGISAHDLGRRLPVANPHDELGRMATAFNLTLERLETAFRDLDRFVGDAAHELRGPLTALRNVGEVGLHRERTPEEYREIIASMLEEEHRVQALLLRLLELAGAESGGRLDHFRPVQLEQLVADCVEQFGLIAELKDQRIELSVVPAPIHTDGVILQQALRNLIDNALKYSPDGSTVRVVLRADADTYRIDVMDQGPGISPEHRSRLAERFFRAGRSNDKSRPGHGLGLSIAKVYLRVLGGNLHYEQLPAGGSCFSLSLPRETTPAGTVPRRLT